MLGFNKLHEYIPELLGDNMPCHQHEKMHEEGIIYQNFKVKEKSSC